MYVLGGVMIADDLTIADCHAQTGGGVLYISSGRVVLRNSFVRRSNERAIHLSGGELHLVNCSVERSASSIPNDGAIAYFATSAATATSGPLLIATFTTFRQHACDAPLFSSPGPLQLVHRDVNFVPGLEASDRFTNENS